MGAEPPALGDFTILVEKQYNFRPTAAKIIAFELRHIKISRVNT